MGTFIFSFTRERQSEALSVLAHPPYLPRWITNHQSKIRDVSYNNSTSTDKGIVADGNTTDNSRIGSDGGTFFDL